MKIHSKELLRAVLACRQIGPDRPLAAEYGMVRIRIGWGIDCCEAFDGSSLIRYYIGPQYDDGERLDGAFEYDPLIAWLSYVDGEIDISENGPVRFEFGKSKLEKGPADATSFPVRNAPDTKGAFVTITKDDWALLQTQLGKLDDVARSTALDAIHLLPGSPAYAGTTTGFGMALCEVESNIQTPTVIPASGIKAAFRAASIMANEYTEKEQKEAFLESITVEAIRDSFCICKGETEIFFQGTAQPGTLDGTIQAVLAKNKPFLTIGLGEVRDAIAAINATNKSTDAKPRALFCTYDGQLYIVGGELFDFRSMPLRPMSIIEFPEDFSQALIDARMLHNALSCIESGQLWFLTDPREGPTEMKVVGDTRQSWIIPMKIKRRQ